MQITRGNINKQNGFSAIMLMMTLGFYLFFACFDGAVICVDSPDYLQMNLTREPLYPLFLAFFRVLFRGALSDGYLSMAVLFQSILAAVAAWSLTAFLYREFHLSKAVSLLILGIPLAVSLLCRFVAGRGSMYSNSILTEGIELDKNAIQRIECGARFVTDIELKTFAKIVFRHSYSASNSS